jgi:hypothetical protein
MQNLIHTVSIAPATLQMPRSDSLKPPINKKGGFKPPLLELEL